MFRVLVKQITNKSVYQAVGTHSFARLAGLGPTATWQVLRNETTATAPSTPSSQTHDATQKSDGETTNEPVRHLDTREQIIEYHRFTDIYLGGLWNKLETELRKVEESSNSFDYDVQLTSGCMRVTLPNDGEVVICKDAQDQELKVESNLHDLAGGGDPRDEACFKLDFDSGEFVNGGMNLHEYLEDHFAKHLKIQMDLEPQPGPHETVYSPDPT